MLPPCALTSFAASCAIETGHLAYLLLARMLQEVVEDSSWWKVSMPEGASYARGGGQRGRGQRFSFHAHDSSRQVCSRMSQPIVLAPILTSCTGVACPCSCCFCSAFGSPSVSFLLPLLIVSAWGMWGLNMALHSVGLFNWSHHATDSLDSFGQRTQHTQHRTRS